MHLKKWKFILNCTLMASAMALNTTWAAPTTKTFSDYLSQLTLSERTRLLSHDNKSVVKIKTSTTSAGTEMVEGQMFMFHESSCSQALPVWTDFDNWPSFVALGPIHPVSSAVYNEGAGELWVQLDITLMLHTPVVAKIDLPSRPGFYPYRITDGDFQGASGVLHIIPVGDYHCFYYATYTRVGDLTSGFLVDLVENQSEASLRRAMKTTLETRPLTFDQDSKRKLECSKLVP